jgi:ribonucleoside-diphosphate reductase alpha chain
VREDLLKSRYFLKDGDGVPIESWEGLCRRVAAAIAGDKDEEKEFFEVLFDCLFLPNTPTLVNAGKSNMSLSACFVLPVGDSMEEIFWAVNEAALVQKSGGGTGFSFSRLRPSGDIVGSTKGIASGPCSFIRVFDTATDVLKQGGTRRGANMGILRVDHPDIMEFIALKKEEDRLSNFNLSVGITDDFMKAPRANGDFNLRFSGKVRKTLKAKDIWDAIIDGAYRNGEPGVIFLDVINRANPTPHLGEFEATNPCGETPLLPYEACVLGSINLSKMVQNGAIDWLCLERVTRVAVKFLDNIIDIQHYPLPEIETAHKGNRKIGLGVMGWGDMLIKLGIPYNSEEALLLAERIMGFMTETSVNESSKLAELKGVFPHWEGSLWQRNGFRVRNATTTTIAPTGSISIIAGCSSGIEPIFDFVTVQTRPGGEYKVVHPLYEEWVSRNGDKNLPPYFLTAKEVSPEWHIKMQAAFQKHTHNAVSKTVNIENGSSRENVERVFLLAYELGCKGVTVYRDGSRHEQVLTSASSSSRSDHETKDKDVIPSVLEAKRVCVETPEGKVYFNISFLDGKPKEIFITTPADSKHQEVYESFARIFSVALRNNVPLPRLTSQLEKANTKYGSVVSVPYALVRAFRFLGVNGGVKCPDCGKELIPEEGCLKCHSCGFTKC